MKGKKVLVWLIIFILLITPTRTFATGYYSDNVQNTIKSFMSGFISFFIGDKAQNSERDYEETTYDKEYLYLDGKEIKKDEWEEYLKKKYPPMERESKDIWKDWCCFDDYWNKYWNKKN